MAYTYAITKEFDRADDVRSLKFRVRRHTPSGTYATNGDSVTAKSVGLKFIAAGIPLNGVAQASDGATAEIFGIVPASDGLTAVIQPFESGAANAALAEKTNTEAPPTGQVVDILWLGY